MSKRITVRYAFAVVAAVLLAGVGLVGYNAYAAETPAASVPRATLAPRSADLSASLAWAVPYAGNPAAGPGHLAWATYYSNTGPSALRAEGGLFKADGFTISIQVDGASGLRLLRYRLSSDGPEHGCARTTKCSVYITSGFAVRNGPLYVGFIYDVTSDRKVDATIEIHSDLPDPDEGNNLKSIVINPG